MHRAEVPRLERGSNHEEPAPLTLASQCGSVRPLPPSSGVYDDDARSLGDYDETRACRPQNSTGFLETPYTVCIGQTTSYNDEPTKPAARQRLDKAQSDGLRRQTTKP